MEAGLEILVADGPPGLTIAALCASLGTTSGSFYHHFGNLHGYTQAVVRHWETRHADQMRSLGQSDGTASTRMLRHRGAILALDHPIDAVMRSWAASDPIVAAAQQRVDELWHSALFALLHDLIGEAGTARRLAVFGRSVVIGYQLVTSTRHHGELDALLADFEQTVRDHYRTEPADLTISKETPCREP
ncbi:MULTISPECIES: TetR/AcrR family transcriptional regulator [unclassified Pseudonocardia]|uniref:TetR/AcrR family transcriptional regulator n=1 Tax=unclassified Pseudonocardia TaxID=2619320 RepID=UPI0001FFF21A|nr:TetR/AcrR family transcriptional regulator [Pseudonocardia sp. Ae707_Ps1]